MDLIRLQKIITIIKDKYATPDTSRLNQAIKGIKHAFIQDWEDYHQDFLNSFLEKIEIGVPTAVLSVCGRGTQEIRFTKYLAYMLDSQKSHGLKDTLYKILFADLVEETSSTNVVVHNEYWLGSYNENGTSVNCFCDIVLEGETFVIFIEQKILSGQSFNEGVEAGQLQRYSKAIKNNKTFRDKKLIKVFLTPNGALPVDVGDWYAITHSYVIEKGLELLTKNINAVPKENLKRFLLDLAIGPYEVTEEVLDEMIILAKQLKEEFALKKAVRFNQLLTDNRLLINVLMEEKIND